MKAAIIHPSFANFGGAEMYAVNIVRALIDSGFDTDVFVLKKKNDSLKGYVSSLKKRVRVVAVKPLIRTSSFYDFIFDTYSYQKIKQCMFSPYNVTINTKANEIPVEADVCVIHYPLGYALYHWDRIPLGAGIDPKYVKKLFWRLYIQPFRLLFHRLSEKLRYCRVVVTNSGWTANLLKKLGGIDSVILYPPIDVERIKVHNDISKERKDLVVTISRFDLSKGLEAVLYIAKHIPKAKFVIIGKISDTASYGYYKHLLNLKHSLKLTNVYFLSNLGEEAKGRILSKAKIYMHPTIGEHFGISVLEALAHGVVPVVHQFSGSCIDIAEEGKYGYCYQTYEDTIDIIRRVLYHGERPPYMHESNNHLSKFSYNNFKRKLNDIISKLLEEKGIKRDDMLC